MEKFPEIIKKLSLPININIQPYLRDHHIAGRIILPAVESCQLLASNIAAEFPDIEVTSIFDASFDKFIEIHSEQSTINAQNEIDIYENGDIISRLITKITSKSMGITRTVKNVSMKFKKDPETYNEMPFEDARHLEGNCIEISSGRIYSDLVAFGMSYQNIEGAIKISEHGVTATVIAAQLPAPNMPLGSPFPFDASMHAACVWGQRFRNIVAFPAGFKRRIIAKPTAPGEKYFCRIIPVETETDALILEIWIYDIRGKLSETIYGLMIKDISGGMIKPPEWIKEGVKGYG